MANGALLLGAVALVIVVAVVRSPIEALGLAAAALLVTGIWLKVKAHRDRDPRVLK